MAVPTGKGTIRGAASVAKLSDAPPVAAPPGTCTLEAFLAHLLDGKSRRGDLAEAFLQIYPAFVTPSELWQALEARYADWQWLFSQSVACVPRPTMLRWRQRQSRLCYSGLAWWKTTLSQSF